MERKQKRKLLTGNKYVFLLAGVFVLFLLTKYWDGFMEFFGLVWRAANPLILGACIAYILNILMSFYLKHLWKKSDHARFKKPVCMGLSFATLIVIVSFIVGTVLPELIRCLHQLFLSIQPAFAELDKLIYQNEDFVALLDDLGLNQESFTAKLPEIANVLTMGVNQLLQSTLSILGSTFSLVVTFFIAVIFSIYILVGKDRLQRQYKDILQAYLPNHVEKITYVCKVLNSSFHSFIVGQCTEAVILGALCAAGMTILRLPYGVMIGSLIGFTALIPIAGAYIGAAVGAVMILTVSPMKALGFLVFLVLLQQLEGNIIYPRVVGKSIGLPGMWVLAAVTIGGGVMGVGGMLIAVPLFAAFYKLVKDDVGHRIEAE